MQQPSRILIYGLLNPANLELFYVGQTRKRREFRLLEHIEDAVGGSTLPVHGYIRRLMECGRIPKIFVLERVSQATSADEIEIRWIQHFSGEAAGSLPLTIFPQTPKSKETKVLSINLQNVRNVPIAKNTEQNRRPATSGSRLG
jgi:hypothetical protein